MAKFLPRQKSQQLLLLAVLVFLQMLLLELKGSYFSAHIFHQIASKFTFSLAEGEQDMSHFQLTGPYDQRLGYSKIPGFKERLSRQHYKVRSQAVLSEEHRKYVNGGFFPIYEEKVQAGLSIRDRQDQVMFDAKYPALVYQEFTNIPDVIVKTLLLIENHHLLDSRHPFRNPAVEWTRFMRAIMDKGIKFMVNDHGVPGGSTLATQIEKFRHSPGGLTSSPKDKLIQMLSASFRAYHKDAKTLAVRQNIVLDYINSVPLGAVPVYGEVIGLGNALEAWFGADFEDVSRILMDTDHLDRDDLVLEERALAYRQVLSLILAQRRPAFYLQQNPEALQTLVDRHLGLLVREGIISFRFAKAVSAAKVEMKMKRSWQRPEQLFFVERKAANTIRVQLLQELGMQNLYELDRFDLTVKATIDYQAQQEVSRILQMVRQPQEAKALGLNQHRLLESNDPSQVHYSFTLMERVGDTYALRVQTDSLGKPFNLNDSGKLELGSTAKLRVLVNYLQVIEEIYLKHADLSLKDLQLAASQSTDPLSRWVIDYLRRGGEKTTAAILENAMDRIYSASPHERFFTGRGVHRFSNFQKEDDARAMSVLHAFRRSVNLPFVRMMRDIVNYHLYAMPDYPELLQDTQHPRRQELLQAFADQEGRQFMAKFYRKYQGDPQALQTLSQSLKRHSHAFAVAFRTVNPEAGIEEMENYIRTHLPTVSLSPSQLQQMYRAYAPDAERLTLQDRGYIARVHPLELYVAAELLREPNMSLTALLESSYDKRMEVYTWLLKSRNKLRQDKRLQVVLEAQAFREIHASWQRLGYPFASLVPTYATALGSSGDRPSALAELVGIILSDGYRMQSAKISDIHFAAGTPFEMHLQKQVAPPERVLSHEVAKQARRALVDVVEAGTGQRLHQALTAPGCANVAIGGKTGTGDNRYRITELGRLTQVSRAVNRTATFVFFVGDRYFGTMTAYVPTSEAENYAFTSALPVQILKTILPKIMPEPLALDCQEAMAESSHR